MNTALLTALSWLLDPSVILFCAGGVFLGIIVGAIPGLTAVMAISILMSFTFGMDATHAIAMLLGIYNGASYGGSIAAILINIPGTPAAVMTTMDGYPMTQKGEGGKAIGIATVSSFLGGILGCIILILGCTVIASLASKFAYPEYFVIAMFGMIIVSASSGKTPVKGFIASCLGLLLSMVGLDSFAGIQRLTFGNPNLLSGIQQVPAMIGIFGISEIIEQLFHIETKSHKIQKLDRIVPPFSEIKRLKKIILQSSLMGMLIGAMPGAGGNMSSFLAYNQAKSTSKYPEKFGTGISDGVAAAESANNATCGGAMIPMLALAVPGDSVTALLMGAFTIQGIYVGPQIFKTNPDIVYGTYLFMLIANVFMLVIGLTAAKYVARLVNLPRKVLLPLIMMICVIGVYCSTKKVFDLLVMLVFGILGFLLRRCGIPSSALILGIVLGGMVESNFRAALNMSKGSYSIFLRPWCLFFWALTLIMVIYLVRRNIRERKKNSVEAHE